MCWLSLIIWCKPFCEINASVFAPSKLVLSVMDQLHDFALKSPKATAKNGLKVTLLSKFNFRFFINELS